MADEFQRIILLNWLVSRSSTRSRTHEAPPVPLSQLLEIIDSRYRNSTAIEYLNARHDSRDIDTNNPPAGYNFIRLYGISSEETQDFRYITLLLEYVDDALKSFPVVDTVSFQGREIEGNPTERGAIAGHVMIRAPLNESRFDLGKYRCAIESVPSLTRSNIQYFLCRQLRRHSDAEEWTFTVVVQQGKRRTPKQQEIRFTPKLELFADVGRNLSTAGDGRELSNMVFTKRAEKQSIGRPAHVTHDDVLAKVEIKIAASQGPADPAERAGWIKMITDWYSGLGFESKLYFRHASGPTLGGELHHAIAGATDLLMCPRELLSLTAPAKRWQATINNEIASGMRAILDRNDLWERSNPSGSPM